MSGVARLRSALRRSGLGDALREAVWASSCGAHRILLILAEEGPLHTRGLLARFGSWGRGQKLLKMCADRGLVVRRVEASGGCGGSRVVNELTPLGRDVVRILRLTGVAGCGG